MKNPKNEQKFNLVCIAETPNLSDLSSIGLSGWRHSAEIMRGLSVFVSSDLQHFSHIQESKFSLYGHISLPALDNYEALPIGFLASYRSPSLVTDEQNAEFFNDLSSTIDKLSEKCDLIYKTEAKLPKHMCSIEVKNPTLTRCGVN